MNTTKHKVSELEGLRLDAAVELCETPQGVTTRRAIPRQFSTDWSLGGPIMERERIGSQPNNPGRQVPPRWTAVADAPPSAPARHTSVTAETMLVAGMRAFVASRFGETVELPGAADLPSAAA